MLNQILFFIFAGICVGGALNLLLQRHPISSALSLIVVMGSLALLYLLLGAEFVAVLQVIVYAGAIMVLFVFVIMLLNAGEEERTRGSRISALVGYPGAAAIVGCLIYVGYRNGSSDPGLALGGFMGSTQNVGKLLFTQFMLPFEVTSILILIAIIGAIVLARKGP